MPDKAATDDAERYVVFKGCGCVAMVVATPHGFTPRMVELAFSHGTRVEHMAAAALGTLNYWCAEHRAARLVGSA